MKKEKWLIFRILDLLATLETTENQPVINQIRGYLFSLMKND